MKKCYTKQVPLVSVVMSVYNTPEKLLREAIESILNQTYTNLEFLIVDDGSDVMTAKIIREYKDTRIHVIPNETNIGLTKSLNIAFSRAKGKYIARMDADDISYPKRLAWQVKFMEKNKDISVVGGWTRSNSSIQKYYGSNTSEYRKVCMMFENAGISHPTALFRKSFLVENNILYDEEFKKAQDYKMWTDILKYGKIGVAPRVVLFYRVHPKQISASSSTEKYSQKYYDRLIRVQLLENLCSTLKENEKEQLLTKEQLVISPEETIQLIEKLKEANKTEKEYNQKILEFELFNFWKRYIKIYIAQKGIKSDIVMQGYNMNFLNVRYILQKVLVSYRKLG